MTAIPAAGYFSDTARINSEAKSAQDTILTLLAEQIGGTPNAVYAVSSNSVTPLVSGVSPAVFSVSGTGATLNTVVSSGYPNGRVILVGVASGSTVTLAHGAGNLQLAGGASVQLNATNQMVAFQLQGSSWVELWRTATLQAPGAVNTPQGSDTASAGTVNLGAATGNYVHITGTTTITAITLPQGWLRYVEFDNVLTLTNSSTLVLPGGLNIVTKAGDTAVFVGESSGVRCLSYSRSPQLYAVMSSAGSPVVPVVGTGQGQFAFGDGATVAGSGVGILALGTSYATGDNAFSAAIGSSSSSYGSLASRAISLGYLAKAAAGSSVAIGDGASAAGVNSIAIGTSAYAGANDQIAIGRNAYTYIGTGACAIGNSAALGANSFAAAIGTNSTSYGAIGTNCVALGLQAKASNLYSVAMQGGFATGIYSFSFGLSSASSGDYSLSFGHNAVASGVAGVAIGESCSAIGDASYVFGKGAKSASMRQFTHGNQRANPGDCQMSFFELSAETFNTTATVALLDWGGSHEITVPTSAAWAFEVTAVARNITTPAKIASFKTTALGLAVNNGGTVTLLAPTGLTSPNSVLGSWSGGSIAVTVNGTALEFKVTAPNTDQIVWTIKVSTVEVA